MIIFRDSKCNGNFYSIRIWSQRRSETLELNRVSGRRESQKKRLKWGLRFRCLKSNHSGWPNSILIGLSFMCVVEQRFGFSGSLVDTILNNLSSNSLVIIDPYDQVEVEVYYIPIRALMRLILHLKRLLLGLFFSMCEMTCRDYMYLDIMVRIYSGLASRNYYHYNIQYDEMYDKITCQPTQHKEPSNTINKNIKK